MSATTSRTIRTALIASLITLVLGLGVLAAFWWLSAGLSHTDYSSDSEPHQIVVGNDVLNIPGNMIRSPEQRQSPMSNRVDLAVTWPQMEGFSDVNAERFQSVEGLETLIFITLSKRALRDDTDARFKSVYRPLLIDETMQLPGNLMARSMRKGTGYDGEEIVYDNALHPRWVARCTKPDGTARALCMRDINLGRTLSVQYRFDRKLLNQWQALELAVIELVQTFAR